MGEEYKFQKLRVYQLALDYVDLVYDVVRKLPDEERFNLASQIRRASTSIPLNIAEGSTRQSDPEQKRFLSMAIRSFLESIACLDLIQRRAYLLTEDLSKIREKGHQLFIKMIAFQKSLN